MRLGSATGEIAKANEGRKPSRVRLKYERMSADPFAFFRGTDHLFARAWADGLRPIEPGPALLICGDLHLENFGAYRADDGEFFFDVNDFDESAVAPCGFDLTRCVASILLASDVWRISPVKAERVALAFLDQYRDAVAGVDDRGGGGGTRDKTGGPVDRLLGRAAMNTQGELLARQTRPDGRGGLRIRGARGLHPKLPARKVGKIREALEAYGEATETPGAYQVLDARGRLAGIGSLGVRRYLVLIRGDGPPDGYRLLDLKEARPSALAAVFPDGPRWPDEATRIVETQRALQTRPAKGLDVFGLGRRRFVVREMVPAENRTSLEQFRGATSRLARAVTIAGRVVGRSHLRGAAYLGPDATGALAEWSAGPGPDAVLAAAVRQATQARRDYRAFVGALSRYGCRLLPTSGEAPAGDLAEKAAGR